MGPDSVLTKAFKALSDEGVVMMTNVFKLILQTGKMPDEWKRIIFVSIFNGKGGVKERSNYQLIKLLSHMVK